MVGVGGKPEVGYPAIRVDSSAVFPADDKNVHKPQDRTIGSSLAHNQF